MRSKASRQLCDTLVERPGRQIRSSVLDLLAYRSSILARIGVSDEGANCVDVPLQLDGRPRELA